MRSIKIRLIIPKQRSGLRIACPAMNLSVLRIVTNGRIMPTPLIPEVAIETVEDWLQQPPSLTIVPSHQHWSIYKELLMPLGTASNLTSDAHLAALAIEHGARIYSTDNDFSRFQSLRWTNPIE